MLLLVVIVSTAQTHRKKGNDDLFDIVVDEYPAEVNDDSIGVPDDANDIVDCVFGDDDFEDDQNFIDKEPSDSEQ